MQKVTCKKSIVLLSGGQDSTTCLYWAKKQFHEVLAIGFNYGQTHVQELKQAKKIAKKANVEFLEINIKGLLSGSSLVENKDHNTSSILNQDLPNTFTVGRNILFLTIASSIGASYGINDIVIGACQTDFNGYPDCRKSTIDALQVSLSLGLGIGDIRIHTPLMYLSKAEIWKMANELGILKIVINDTLTDYNGSKVKNEWGFGVSNNSATKLRMDGYFEAKQKQWI